MTYRDSKFWTRFSLVAASTTLALSLSPAMFAQSTTTPSAPIATPSTPIASTPPANDKSVRQEDQETFDQFNRDLSKNPALEKQIRDNPSLLNNPQFLASHPQLNKFLQDHPSFANAVKENPGDVLHKDTVDTKEAHEQHNEDVKSRDDVRSFDDFAHQDPAAAKQLMNNPSLANNPEFLAKNPEAASYLNSHPGVVHAMQTQPEAFKNHVEHYNQERVANHNNNHKTPPSKAPQGHPVSRQ
jgi:hypothetical protein